MEEQDPKLINQNSLQEEILQKEKSKPQFLRERKLWFVTGGVIIAGILLVAFLMLNSWRSQLISIQKDVDANLKSQNFNEASKSLQEGLRKFPNDPGLLARQIDLNSSQGNISGTEVEMFDKNKDMIAKALKDHGNDYSILISVGYAYETSGQYDKALEYYSKAISIKPDSSTAYFHKGHTLAFLNRQDEADKAYDKAYELDNNNNLAIVEKARILYSQGKADESISLLQKVIGSDTAGALQKAEAGTAASYIEFGRGNSEKALTYSSEALKSDPEYAQALAMYGYLQAFKKETYAVGVENIKKAIAQNPRISQNYFLMGIVMRSYSFYPQAVAFQKKALEVINDDNTLVGRSALNAQKSRMDYELGITYSLMKDVDNAVNYLHVAINENPEYKKKLEKDINSGVFNNIKSNGKFLELI